ncbi:hypothetical protein FRC03_003055 [Tulasnella sp. 419]|nr:hypothetical protein FRC03_003055 [Tulasnella sp. 419]
MEMKLDRHLDIVKQLLELFTDKQVVESIQIDYATTMIVMAWVSITGAEEFECAVEIDKRKALNTSFAKAAVHDALQLQRLTRNGQEKSEVLGPKMDGIHEQLLEQYAERINALSGIRPTVATGPAQYTLHALIEISENQFPFLRKMETDLTNHGLLSVPHRRRRYAVLIGIRKYEAQGTWPILEGAHNDLKLYRKILQNAYDFDDKEIVELSDEVDPSSPLYPNRKNIERELRRLGSSIKEGDLGFLGYSGHAKQIVKIAPATSNNSEIDQTDEAIVPIDDKPGHETIIIDNLLNEWLVAPLPQGAELLVALDCCASETLLDLPFKYVVMQHEDQLQLSTEHAHLTSKGGKGFVLCISACKDDQKAHEIRRKTTGQVFGAMTALLYHLFNDESVAEGANNATNMKLPTVKNILTKLREYFKSQENEAMVQITTSQPLPDPIFGSSKFVTLHE